MITAAGVSAGIDMALHLVVRLDSFDAARRVKRGIQYDPNITEIVPAELSGYCDVGTGECITVETGTPHAATTEDVAETIARRCWTAHTTRDGADLPYVAL